MKEVERYRVAVEYSIFSPLGEVEGKRYIQSIYGTILEMSDNTNDPGKPIGRIEATKVLLGQARNNNYSHFEIFDYSSELYEIGEDIYDFKRSDYKEKVEELFGFITDSDLLILNHIELIPEYRGHDLGKYAIKDLYINFISGTAYLITKLPTVADDDPTKKPIHKLAAYFMTMGFEMAGGFSKDLLFINQSTVNEALNAIELD